jgi:AmiR/NasT family two-component response regulator
MAVGLVMQRYAMTGERALGYLIRVSQSSSIQLRTLAEQIVDEANVQLRDAP